MKDKDRTLYSKKFRGDKGNYGWTVSFDVTDGYVGINQSVRVGTVERVLLSPSQYKALLRFMAADKSEDAGK